MPESDDNLRLEIGHVLFIDIVGVGVRRENRRQTMSAQAGEPIDPKFEIGHVLFIDLVGYSKLLIEEQKERLRPAHRDRAGDDAGARVD